MDAFTTNISRNVVNWIKDHLNGEIPKYRDESIPKLKVVVEFERVATTKLRAFEGYFHPSVRIIYITVQVPSELDLTQLNSFIPKFKEVLRHELEHFRQSQRQGSTHYKSQELTRYNHQNGVGAITGPYISAAAAREYFLMPEEVEAWVMGLYKRAKGSKEPLMALLRQESAAIAKRLLVYKVDPGEAKKVSEEILFRWKEYARKRLSGLATSEFGVLD